MNEITLNAHAKINLSLRVIRRREDGYHDISSLMQGIDIYDVIKISKCLENGTKYNLPHCDIDGCDVYLCTGAETIPTDMSNLAFKGAKVLLDEIRRRGKALIPEALIIEIDKRLPVAAGIAGGSGNAAASMLGINALMGSPLSLSELMTIGIMVGADVPFSLMMNARLNDEVLNLEDQSSSSAAMVEGIGEIVKPTEPIFRHIIIANPGIAVSTRAAYEAIDALKASSSDFFTNDFELYTLTEYDEAKQLYDLMKMELRAERILMSGSGPSIVAYYQDAQIASEDFDKFKHICDCKPGYRAWLTTTGKL